MDVIKELAALDMYVTLTSNVWGEDQRSKYAAWTESTADGHEVYVMAVPGECVGICENVWYSEYGFVEDLKQELKWNGHMAIEEYTWEELGLEEVFEEYVELNKDEDDEG